MTIYQVIPNSQKVLLASFHVEGEANEWWQWLKQAYKEDDKDNEEKFLHWNLEDKVLVIVGVLISREDLIGFFFIILNNSF